MTPLTNNPTVVILLAPKTDEVMAVASNIAPIVANDAADPLTVVVTRKVTDFNTAAEGKSFNSTR